MNPDDPFQDQEVGLVKAAMRYVSAIIAFISGSGRTQRILSRFKTFLDNPGNCTRHPDVPEDTGNRPELFRALVLKE